ncbi:UNVERIFIED_CONTAM: hypothetical protein PYX00_005789 [Menopon gallinae]|uniref:leucine--tRNA ligase n=1 Tax=Menopon gallinae TaxID=328185 RepID=A0AAW2HT03_9NEOP
MILVGISYRRLFHSGWRHLSAENILQRKSNKVKTCGIIGREISGVNKWESKWSTALQKEIEEYWTSRIDEKAFEEDSEKQKCYVLSMFPYPSGNVHMGHVRLYCLSDVYARWNKLKGLNVIHPMGWDAFGLPAENAAIERNLNPKQWTQKNIDHIKSVLERLNLSFDWNRELATCDPDYYKWTQYLFLKLYENGMAYRKLAFVNWDPVDQTVLADEQVSENGRSWRSGAVVEKKLITQWFVRTTRYSLSLAEGLKDLHKKDWRDVINMQTEWIGDPVGTTLDFEVVDNPTGLEHKFLTVWLEKPEYVHKIKFIAVPQESAWNSNLVVSGILPYRVKNPLSGEVIPVYVADQFPYTNAWESYAGMPDLVECDREYANSVKLKYTVGNDIRASEEELAEHRQKICEDMRKMGVGGYPASSKLRDWLISRQRYWGTPIPIVYCEKCGEQPVPEEELPVQLPEVKNFRKGVNTLSEEKEWVNTVCPKCGGHARRETDTMDTFVDSSWYYLRYLDPDNESAPFSVEKAKKFMPVDMYLGGVEHAILHLYYARFVCHFLHSAGLVPQREPFKRLLMHGSVRGLAYQLKNGAYVRPEEVEEVDGKKVHKPTGEVLKATWEKMSKSKYNGVEPEVLLEKYGTDLTRLAVFADVGPRSPRDWSDSSFRGIMNWMWRLWTLIGKFRAARTDATIEVPEDLNSIEEKMSDSRNYSIDMVEHSLEETMNPHFCIKKLQCLSNDLKRVDKGGIAHSLQYERALAALIIMLAPMAPCFASELWAGFATAPNRKSEEIQWDKSVFQQSWPAVDDGYVSKFSERKMTMKEAYDRRMKEKKLLEKAAAAAAAEAENQKIQQRSES